MYQMFVLTRIQYELIGIASVLVILPSSIIERPTAGDGITELS